MELKKCKLCGKEPYYNKKEDDGLGTHSGWVVISCSDCGIQISLTPDDIDMSFKKGTNGYEAEAIKLREADRLVKLRWNKLNSPWTMIMM